MTLPETLQAKLITKLMQICILLIVSTDTDSLERDDSMLAEDCSLVRVRNSMLAAAWMHCSLGRVSKERWSLITTEMLLQACIPFSSKLAWKSTYHNYTILQIPSYIPFAHTHTHKPMSCLTGFAQQVNNKEIDNEKKDHLLLVGVFLFT